MTNALDPLHLIAGTVTLAAQADDGQPRRTISGLAVPYGVEATVSGGRKVRFLAGSLPTDGKAPKLLEQHDSNRVIGIVTAREETADGMTFSARISASRAGDDVLELVKDGALDSVSVGVDPVEAEYDETGVLVIAKAQWRELSVVTEPAFANARISQVAATSVATSNTEETMTNETPNTNEAPAPAPTAPVWAEAKRVPTKLPTVAEYMAAYVRGGESAEAARREVAAYQAHHAPIAAAAGDQTTTDFPGVIPVPILGPTFDNIAPLRPLVTAIGARPMPGSGKTFIRPKIVTHTSVAQQASELAGLSSTTMLVDDIVVTKLTFGGTVLVSEQTVDFSDPAALEIIVRDMANQYAIQTGNYACTQFANNIGGAQQVGTWDGTSEDFIAKVYEGAAAILAAGRVMPTHLILGTPGFEAVGALVDGANRPLFPTLNPMNASGVMSATSTVANPVGLSLVVDPGLDYAGDFIALGNAAGSYAGFEIFETMKGLVSIEKPDVLGRQISVRGYFAAQFIDVTKFRWFDF
jgi:HK97 family phage prohead protease